MRLKLIKISGFKSFVDPTVIKFSSNMCAVVGPNGCGKSNVIDAVRWVMGESSAKFLRGESMTDVIFKGSKQRKPANKTTVELLFDNYIGKISGEYATYNEISIKRSLTTDAKNNYFLNNTKCRRKDIMDIFLGTGLGPRSYAIISQGMISNLIESKPEELRSFIEEAAGISKYKERRRETSNRVRRTTENLERLSDLREELGRQLKNLHNQAKIAEKYKELKAEQRLKKAEQQALRWKNFNDNAQKQHLTIKNLEIKLDDVNAEHCSLSSLLEVDRELQIELSDSFQKNQDSFYQFCSSVATAEQKIAHRDTRLRELSTDLDQISTAWENAKQQLDFDQKELINLQRQEQELLPNYEMYQAACEQAQTTLEKTELDIHNFQLKWDSFNQKISAEQIITLEQAKIEHAEQILARLQQRKFNFEQELATLNNVNTQELTDLEEKLTTAELTLDNLADEINANNDNLQNQRIALGCTTEELANTRTVLNKNQGKLASLEAIQMSSIVADKKTNDWLKLNKLDKLPKIIDKIEVASGWELAVETMLDKDLQAICIDTEFDLEASIKTLNQGTVTLVTNNNQTTVIAKTKLNPLVDKLKKGKDLVNSLLANVYTADNLSSALAARSSLSATDIIITIEGIIVAKDWIKVKKTLIDNQSSLMRKQDIEKLEEEINIQQEIIENKLKKQDSIRQQLMNQENLREQLQANRNEYQQEKLKTIANIEAITSRIEDDKNRYNRIKKDLTEIDSQYNQEKQTISGSRTKLQYGLDNMEADQNKKQELQQEKQQLNQLLQEAKSNYQNSKEILHKHELELKLIQNNITALNTAISRLSKQATESRAKRDQINQAILQVEDPDDTQQIELEDLLQQKIIAEQKMQDAKQQLEEIEHRIRTSDQNIQQKMQLTENFRTQLEQLRMQRQELRIKATALEDQLREDKFDITTVLKNLSDDADLDIWEQELQKLDADIENLGLVNLAAIDEYKIQEQRKIHLDTQNDDLTAALEVLETVIKRIDKETKKRFKTTFDLINSGLAYLFPKVFAGGNAYLQLTDEDLLLSGVTIMAQPPGKKNSTIHLLSGGEKALTAIALVFAIFQLNPSPFCMLDEVDAPLDDSNVGRYAKIVAEMSEKVQFIYITHNKIAMQAANELIGVTMYEPGVSRPVSVNVEQATVMAEN